MSFLTTVENISFKKILGVTFVALLALAMPMVVWISQQETKLEGRAFFEKPEVIKPVKKFGAPSPGEPRIDLVWPFLGKIGDAVLIEGENFGDNPQNKQIKIGNQIVAEENINQWTPALIEFSIPQGATSSLINLQTAGKSVSWPYLFIIYDLKTEIQVTENNDIVSVLNPPHEGKIEIFFSDGERMESNKLDGINVPSDKTILTAIVKNKTGDPIPFFVEPEEFGF